MQSIALELMTEQEFGGFMQGLLQAYVIERAAADRISRDAAEAYAREQHAGILPAGRHTPGHHFLRIVPAGSSRYLGGIWLHADRASGHAFLYYITVLPEFRRQRIARRAMALLQDFARGLGCGRIALNVFATNAAAIELYRTLGFEVVSSHMDKAL